MAGWIFDEDIARVTVKKFADAGIKGPHIKDDLKKGGSSDEDVLKTAQQERKTLITSNTYDYLEISNVDYHNTYGAWILSTEDPDKQVELVKLTLQATGLNTLNKRKEKKLHIKNNNEVDVIDCRTQKTKTYKLNEIQKSSKKKLQNKRLKIKSKSR